MLCASVVNALKGVIVGSKEYKVGVVLSVNVTALRKDLEDAGIIKSLGAGFN